MKNNKNKVNLKTKEIMCIKAIQIIKYQYQKRINFYQEQKQVLTLITKQQ